MLRQMIVSVVAAGLSAAPLAAQGAFRTPTLGYVWDAGRSQVRPILGIAGASYLGDAAPLALTPARALFPPQHDFALILDNESQSWKLYRAEDGSLNADLLAALPGQTKTVAFSPNGRTIAAMDGTSLRIFSGLPSQANARTVDAGSGLTLLAVSDRGAAVLADADGVAYLASEDGTLQNLQAGGRIAAAAFRFGSNDMALADRSGNRLLLRPATGEISVAAAAAEGIDQPQSLDFTDDGQRLVLIQGSPARLGVLALDGSGLTSVDCPCEVSGLTKLAGKSVFQVQPGGNGPVWILDAGRANARALFVGAGPALARKTHTDGGDAQ